MFPASSIFRLAVLLLIAGFAVFPVAGRVLADTAPTQSSADTTTVAIGKLEGMVCGGASYELAFFATAGSTVSLPDIFITENRIGALRTDGFVALAISTGRIAAFDISHATLKAYRTSDNSDVTAYLIDRSSLASHVRGMTANMTFRLANISDAMTGAARIVLSGVKADITTTAYAGDVNLTVGGAAAGNPDLDLPVGDVQGIGSDLGSRASKSILKVGYIGSSVIAVQPSCTPSGSRTSWNAECEMYFLRGDVFFGKPGSVFIAAIVPDSSGVGGIYFKDDCVFRST